MTPFSTYLKNLHEAQSAYENAQVATVAALNAAVDAGAGEIDGDVDVSPAFAAYEASEAHLIGVTTMLLQAAGRFSVECYIRTGKPVRDIEALRALFMPYFTGNTENVPTTKRNALVASVLAMNFW
jgi:hypothetical protein